MQLTQQNKQLKLKTYKQAKVHFLSSLSSVLPTQCCFPFYPRRAHCNIVTCNHWHQPVVSSPLANQSGLLVKRLRCEIVEK